MSVDFWVPGAPASQGSKRAFVAGGKAVIVEDCARNRSWRLDVAAAAAAAMGPGPAFTGPVILSAQFHFPRPGAHFGSGRNAGCLRATAPRYPGRKPDLSKIVRALEDALTGIVYRDDAQIVMYDQIWKVYGDHPGVQVSIRLADDEV